MLRVVLVNTHQEREHVRDQWMLNDDFNINSWLKRSTSLRKSGISKTHLIFHLPVVLLREHKYSLLSCRKSRMQSRWGVGELEGRWGQNAPSRPAVFRQQKLWEICNPPPSYLFLGGEQTHQPCGQLHSLLASTTLYNHHGLFSPPLKSDPPCTDYIP